MKNVNKIIKCTLAVAAAAACIGGIGLFTGCSHEETEPNLMLHLSFDEGKGTTVKDSAKKVPDGTVRYVLSDPQYQDDPQDPQWRKSGVKGGSLLFDGYSNFISYDYEDIKVRGNAFSVSVYVAPRAFEWDDPNGRQNGTAKLTAIVSQMYQSENQGFVLGYQRHGAWSFQVGTGEEWFTVWNDEGMELRKYEWNHIVATFDGANSEMRIYLNGALAGKKEIYDNSKISAAVDEPLYVGRNSRPNSDATANYNMVTGLVDELKLYNKVMTDGDAKSLYNKYKLPEIEFEDIWLQNILQNDYFKTQLHGGPYQHWMNEPHAPMYYNGKYHLFFQFNLFGPYFHNICWGHLISDDMVNWKPLKEVITPTAGTVAPDGVWSGGVTYDKNGVPIIFFTAGNDSFRKDGLISNQNVGVAYPKDITDPELTEWVVLDELAIKQQTGQGRTGEFRDMHIWKEGETWCMLIGTGSTTSAGGTAILYTATNLEKKSDGTIDMNWQYRGPIYTMTNQSSSLGQVWELPVILPLKNDSGTVSKHVFLFSPAPASTADNKIYYFLGNFNVTTGKFTPDAAFDNNPQLLDYGCNVFTGPSGFIDPVSKDAYVFSIMQDQRGPAAVAASGWANCVGFARKLWLNDAGTDVKMAPIAKLKDYEKETLVDLISPKTVAEANAALDGVGTDMMYVRVKFENIDATSFGISVKCDDTDETRYSYNVATKLLDGTTTKRGDKTGTLSAMSGKLEIADNTLVMEVYIDRSLVEAFFNSDKALTIRSYSAFDATGIKVFADGGSVTVSELYVASLKTIY